MAGSSPLTEISVRDGAFAPAADAGATAYLDHRLALAAALGRAAARALFAAHVSDAPSTDSASHGRGPATEASDAPR